MTVDPQIAEATKSMTNIITPYLVTAVLIGALIGMPLGLLVIFLENKAGKLGKSFRNKHNRKK